MNGIRLYKKKRCTYRAEKFYAVQSNIGWCIEHLNSKHTDTQTDK